MKRFLFVNLSRSLYDARNLLDVFDIDSSIHGEYLDVPSTSLAKTLQVLGVKIICRNPHPGAEDIIELTTEPNGCADASIDDGSEEFYDSVICGDIARAVLGDTIDAGQRIELRGVHQHYRPVNDGVVRISVYSTIQAPDDSRPLQVKIDQIFGIPTGHYNDVWKPSLEGAVLYSPEGDPVVQVIGKEIYVLHACGFRKIDSQRRCFLKSLELAKPYIADPHALEELCRQQQAERQAANDQAYVECFTSELAAQVKEDMRCESELKSLIEGSTAEHAELCTKRERALQLLEQSARPMTEDNEKALVTALYRMAGLLLVQAIGDNRLDFFFDENLHRDPRDNRTYRIGRLAARVLLGHSADSIRWSNIDRHIVGHAGDQFFAPHIRVQGSGAFAYGKACYGGFQGKIDRAIRSGQPQAMALQLWRFLDCLNVTADPNAGQDAWGQFVNFFPLVEESAADDSSDELGINSDEAVPAAAQQAAAHTAATP